MAGKSAEKSTMPFCIFLFLRAGAVCYGTKLLCLHLRASPCAQALSDGGSMEPRLPCLRLPDSPCAQARTGVSGIVSLIIAIPPLFARRRGGLCNKAALLTLARLSLRAGADGRVPQTKQKVRLSKTEKGDRMILDYQEREAIR